MKDTRPEIERQYRAMLLARSPEERLKIGCSMHATARSLVRASVLAKDPLTSPAELRRAMFLRFYGHEFRAADRERIMAWLGRESAGTAEAPRLVPVNWDDLEMALTTNPGEWTSYLDVRSGEVRMVDRYGDSDDQPSTTDEIHAGLSGGHLVYIEPLGSSVEYRWMREFADSVADHRLRTRLEVALDGRGAFRRFKNMLAGHPAEREEWFAFRDVRVRAAAKKWLAERGIEATPSASTRDGPDHVRRRSSNDGE